MEKQYATSSSAYIIKKKHLNFSIDTMGYTGNMIDQ